MPRRDDAARTARLSGPRGVGRGPRLVPPNVEGMDFDLAALSRHPDVEADNLFAVDAADRLLLDEAADAIAAFPGRVAVAGDGYGALTLGAIARHGARGVRVHQDPLVGERALARNAARFGLTDAYTQHALDDDLFADAEVVLLRLPRALDALDELAETAARTVAAGARVFAGGMVKHMTPVMNDVLRRHFGRVDVTHARQKARVLIAAEPIRGAATWPRSRVDAETGLTVVAHGAAFAGPAVDIGTRFLLAHLDDAVPDAAEAIDLGCGTGVLATALCRRRPGIRVLATDQSAAAVASAALTAAANGVADRIRIVRDDALVDEPEERAQLVVLNPPFHIGAAVHTGLARRLFRAAGRALVPGGELWTVWNSHLRYRSDLERLVGPTRQIARNATFTITASRKS